LSCSRSITLLPKKEFSVAFDLFTFSIFSKNECSIFLDCKVSKLYLLYNLYLNFFSSKEPAFS
jgi:hypothetical protein